MANNTQQHTNCKKTKRCLFCFSAMSIFPCSLSRQCVEQFSSFECYYTFWGRKYIKLSAQKFLLVHSFGYFKSLIRFLFTCKHYWLKYNLYDVKEFIFIKESQFLAPFELSNSWAAQFSWRAETWKPKQPVHVTRRTWLRRCSIE